MYHVVQSATMLAAAQNSMNLRCMQTLSAAAHAALPWRVLTFALVPLLCAGVDQVAVCRNNPPSNTKQFHLSSMGNSLVTPSSRAPGSALPSGAINGQAESSMSNREAPSHVPALKSRALGPMGVAESRDSAPTVTPRQVQIADSPSRSKASPVARALLQTGLRCWCSQNDTLPSSPPPHMQSLPQASGTGGWVADESGGSRSRNDANARKSLERKSVELFEAQMSKKLEVEKSGRSIARRDSKDIERATPEEALQDLLDGNARFMIGESDHPHQNFQRMQKIAPKQKPTVAILACADSRVPVELIFDMVSVAALTADR